MTAGETLIRDLLSLVVSPSEQTTPGISCARGHRERQPKCPSCHDMARFIAAYAPREQTVQCKGCEQGLPVMMLDEDGTRTDLTRRPGVPSHAVDDAWWPCPRWVPARPPSEQTPEPEAIRALIAKMRNIHTFDLHEACDCQNIIPQWADDLEALLVSPTSEQTATWENAYASGYRDSVDGRTEDAEAARAEYERNNGIPTS